MNSSPLPQSQSAHQAPTPKGSETAATSLRDRLKVLTVTENKVQNTNEQPSLVSFKTPKEPKFFDVTAAFFSGPMNSHLKNQPKKKPSTPQAPLPRNPVHPSRSVQKQPQKQQQTPQQRHGQTPRRDFNVSESPAAQELIQTVAAQSNQLYDKSVTKLSELDTSLRDTRANVTIRDEQLLARVELSTRKYCKPVSETTVIDDYVDNLGVVNKKTVHVGERVTLVKSRLRVLEDELTSLWGQLEDAQQQVDALFAELAKRDEEGVPDERGSTATVRASLLQEVAKFEKELEDILDDTHEEARASEKDFSRRIQSVQHTFLQGYLLQY